MLFRQLLHPATGCASYLFGCLGKRALAVVDPHIEHVEDYLALAASVQTPITTIVERHVSVDHLAGACLLAERTDAPIYLHQAADVLFPTAPSHDGEDLALGNDSLRMLYTPPCAAHTAWRASATGGRTGLAEPWP